MSTANDLREAACTFPLPYIDNIDFKILDLFLTYHECIAVQHGWGIDYKFRTFLLIVAEALDGGERKPLEGDEFIDMLLDNAGDPASLMREVEEFHGIGV